MFMLIDCDNFFVSCERIFRPGLKNRPVVVLSSNDGCVIARSYEAKALGIPMGVPFLRSNRFWKSTTAPGCPAIMNSTAASLPGL